MTHGERPVERRLRQALDARAAGITVRELRPADPPGLHVRRLPAARLRLNLRRFALPLAGLATAAAAVAGYLVLGPDPSPARPVPPASPPEITGPGPTPGSPAGTGSPHPSVAPSSPTPPTTPGTRSPQPPGPTPTPSGGRSAAPPSRSMVPSASPSSTPLRSSPPPSAAPSKA
ncbi:hypothetical protein [Streptomyces sp. WM6372]|uniref:hypothetical protein n=1 Tax=Streptomyces sp. WM6372 TaxID=1415555 RepID=UPI0006AFEF55|nr:hypothetical protein [Streptomyces sp. WM6372]